MIIKTIWKKFLPLDELHICANPENKKEVKKIISIMKKREVITLINPTNSRNVIVEYSEILSIESYTQTSIVKVIGEKQEYFINKRLKELDFLNQYGLFRVSNSIMLNIKSIQSFQVVKNARLNVITKDNHSYTVSRHYAKQIKEKLTCSNI